MKKKLLQKTRYLLIPYFILLLMGIRLGKIQLLKVKLPTKIMGLYQELPFC